MSLDADIRVTKQMEDATYIDDKRISTIRVEFRVGTHGPFVERFAKEEFTAEARDRKLNAFAREIRTT